MAGDWGRFEKANNIALGGIMNAEVAREKAAKVKAERDDKEIEILLKNIFTRIDEKASEGYFQIFHVIVGIEYEIVEAVRDKLKEFGYDVEFSGTYEDPHSQMRINW